MPTTELDTVNNLGSLMSDRMQKGMRKSLTSKDSLTTPIKDNKNPDVVVGYQSDYTPVSYTTKEMYKEMELSTAFGVPDSSTWVDTTSTKKDNDGNDFDDADLSYGPGNSLVINPPFQFNENDDVRSDSYFKNIGRVYNETIHNNYPICVFEVGRIKHSKFAIAQFSRFNDDPNSPKLRRMIKGEKGLIGDGVMLIRGVIRTGADLILAPARYLLGLKKFSTFINDTGLFAAYVDETLVRVASMFGLVVPIGDGPGEIKHDEFSNEEFDKALEQAKLEREQAEATRDSTEAANYSSDTLDIDPSEQLKETDEGDLSWLKTGDKLSKFLKGLGRKYAGTMPYLGYYNIVPGKSPSEKKYIPVLIHKDVSVSESISNATTSNPLQENINAKAKENEDFNMMGTGGIIDGVNKMVKDTANRVKNVARGESGVVLNGDGRIVLDDIWNDSNFSRSYNVDLTFSSPYGDDLSVFENTFIPFTIFFCMASSRQTGRNTYTSPFIIRASARSLFSCPAGIIESMTITRGNGKNDWTVTGKPKTIKVSLSIKDLSPLLMMGLNKGIFNSLYNSNESFGAYLNVLGGLSLADQKRFLENAGRFYDNALLRLNNFYTGGVNRLFVNHSGKFGLRSLMKLQSVKVAFSKDDVRRRIDERGF